MTFIPTVQAIRHIRPTLPRAATAHAIPPELAARYPDLPAKLREIAKQNIMEAARLHLRLNGIEATPETLEAERAEMARLRQKYSGESD